MDKKKEKKVKCKICGKEFNRITHTHLKKHGLTFEEYIEGKKKPTPEPLKIPPLEDFKQGSSINHLNCYKILSAYYKKKDKNVILNDRETVFGMELDMSIPFYKVAIEWDGKHHRQPLFGEEKFELQKQRDAKKEKELYNKGWVLIRVQDNGKASASFVNEKVEEIIRIIKAHSEKERKFIV